MKNHRLRLSNVVYDVYVVILIHVLTHTYLYFINYPTWATGIYSITLLLTYIGT